MRSMLLTICFFLPGFAVTGQVECCDLPECEQVAQDFIEKILPLVSGLGEAPGNAQNTREKLALLQLNDPDGATQLMRLIREYNEWVGGDGLKSHCFTSKIPSTDQHSGTWVLRLATIERDVEFRSAEFCRGLSWQFEAGVGATNLTKRSEGFFASLQVLLAYTFAPTDNTVTSASLVTPSHCGGRIRLMAGLSQMYVARRGLVAATSRLEYRLCDLKKPMTSFGNVKLLGQVSLGLNRNLTLVGVGAAVELGKLGFQLMPAWTTGLVDNLWQVGLFYRT